LLEKFVFRYQEKTELSSFKELSEFWADGSQVRLRWFGSIDFVQQGIHGVNLALEGLIYS